MEIPTKAELRKLKVVELRQKLSAFSLPQSGVKEVLISRLIERYEQDQQDEQKEDSPPVSEGSGEAREEEEAMVVSINTPDVPTKDTNGTEDMPPEPIETVGSILQAVTSETTQVQVPPSPADAQSPQATPASPPPVDQPHPLLPPADQSLQAQPSPPTLPPTEQPQTLVPQTSPPPTNDGSVEATKGGRTSPLNSSETPPGRKEGQLEEEQAVEPPPASEKSGGAGEEEEEESMDVATGGDASMVDTAGTEDTPPEPTGTSIPQASAPVNQPHPRSPADLQPPQPSQPHPLMPPVEQPHPLMPPVEQPHPLMPPVEQPHPLLPRADQSQPHPLIPQTAPPPTSKPLPLMAEPMGIPQASMTSDYFSASDGGLMEASKEDKAPPTKTPGEGKKERQKRKKKKRRRRRHDETSQKVEETAAKEPEVEIEYVQEDLLKPGDPNYRQFHRILEAFRIPEPEEQAEKESKMTVSQLVAQAAQKSKNMAAQDLDSSSDEEKEKEEKQLSKKKLRKLNRLTVAQLKQLVERPDVVEMHDVTAMDPRLLIHLKSTRNSVPVPRHWCFKRKYLQGKRGIEKPPFDLPDFIKATGVMEMRQALEDKEDAKSLKQKTRERVRPKMGKLTIDYQKLHDAFFKWQTKPKMTIHGDLYYEGKEFETRLRQKKPGDLSDDLRRALGMPTGLGKHKFPPPWLVAMQRYGPPPSYPNLKIPGLNAPIPENTSFGYFVGGWGKPPVDETGRPLYGDVFGLERPEVGHRVQREEEIDRSIWGELESEEEEEEEDEEESDGAASPKPEDIAAGLVTPMEGLVTPSGLTSIPAGLETPDMIQLRKKKIEEAMEQGGETPALYTVIPEKTAPVGGAMMGSSHVYDVATAQAAPAKKANAVDVALDPSELDLDTATITARYEEQVREKRNAIQKEDLSDMVAEHAAKQKKRKRAATDSASGGKAAKKMKEFKF